MARRQKKSGQFLEAMSGFDRFVVMTHDNPDPDAIASGWAMVRLLSERLDKPVRFVAGGAILRAENAHLVRLLDPPLELVTQLPDTTDAGVVLVDRQRLEMPGDDPAALARRLAVIDHHGDRPTGPSPRFRDVRRSAAACASIVASYLRDQEVTPSRRLATAISYALETETRGMRTHHSRLDRTIVRWASTWADPQWLAEIHNAPLSRAYFADLVLAIQNTFIYEDVALCFMPRASTAEIVGEVADLLIRCEGVTRVLCAAGVKRNLLLSVRAESADAAALLRQTLDGLEARATGGGHRQRAGGRILGGVSEGNVTTTMGEALRRQWLRACDIQQTRGTRLVRRQEIYRHL
ncbi:MAG: DHH family phosphoesterase [Phycisphaeraceae bacterium]